MASAADSTLAYPVAKAGDTVDTLHGVDIPDPFRGLEEDTPETKEWVASQVKLWDGYLSKADSIRSKTRARLDEVFNYAKIGCPRKHGDTWYVYHNTGLQNQYVLYQLDGVDPDVSKAKVFLDLNEEFPQGNVALRASAFSPDGRFFAYALSVSGSDWSTIKVRDTASGEDLPDRVRWVKFSGISWLADSSGFFFQRYAAPQGVAPPNVEAAGTPGAATESGAEEGEAAASAGTETASVKGHMVFFHRLGASDEEDRLVFRYEENPDNTLGSSVTSDGRYVLLYVSNGCDPVNKLYYLDTKVHADAWEAWLGGAEAPLPFVKLVDNFEAEFSDIANDGNRFWFRTNLNAPRYKVVCATLPEGPEAEAAVSGKVGDGPGDWQVQDWVPEDEEGGVLDSASVLNSAYLFTVVSRHAADRLLVRTLYQPDQVAEVPLPGPGSVGLSGKRRQAEVHIKYVSYLYPGSVFKVTLPPPSTAWSPELPYSGEGFTAGQVPAYVGELPPLSVASDNVQAWAHTTVPGFDPADFTAEQFFVESTGGVKVPYTVVRTAASASSGPVPTLMYGYGGFNISLTPWFSAPRLVWLKELGGAWVLANIRGGGEYGEEWHKDGSLRNKQHCFDDFAAVGQALVDSGVTTPAQLGIQGGSNGGLLTLVSALQFPHLYRAAISQVPVADMLRFHKFTIGHAWITDYGCADESKEWLDYLLTYSPLHNVKAPQSPAEALPAVLICTADHDDRVVPGPHAFKMAATLQTVAGASPHQQHPLLIRIEQKAGHGAGKPTAKVLDEVADQYAFLATELGGSWH